MTRNHFICYGLILLGIGLQLLVFQSFVLTEDASKFYYEKVEREIDPDYREVNRVVSAGTNLPFARKKIEHPSWLGWPFVSVGAVLLFQSIAMRNH